MLQLVPFTRNILTTLGVVINQASKNAISILLGTIIGAVNTIVILPKAFEGFEEGWGLLKVLTAYALIFSQFFHAGIPNAIIRYFPKLTPEQRPAFLGWSYAIVAAGSFVFTLSFWLLGPQFLSFVAADDASMLSGHEVELIILSLSLIVFYALNGYLSAVLKTTFYQFLNETFLKAWFLLVAVGFWFNFIDFQAVLQIYVGGYVLASVLLLVYSLRAGLTFERGYFALPKRELYRYSLYSILDRGSALIVNNLDIIMVGLLIGLEDVAFYTLAFYIGAVAMLPQKSILSIANPIVSKAIAENDRPALLSIYKQSSAMQLLIGGFIFVSIWISIDEVLALLPERYEAGKWVVLYIGI
ncbi:MAG: hypothetical protein RL226_592, partial [Bacteroidota bacterium]